MLDGEGGEGGETCTLGGGTLGSDTGGRVFDGEEIVGGKDGADVEDCGDESFEVDGVEDGKTSLQWRMSDNFRREL